jgi:hypothetical protein
MRILDLPRDQRAHLGMMPRAKRVAVGKARTDKNGAAIARQDRVFQRSLPRLARDEIPFVEPWLDVGLPSQALGNSFNQRFVRASMGKKNLYPSAHGGGDSRARCSTECHANRKDARALPCGRKT